MTDGHSGTTIRACSSHDYPLLSVFWSMLIFFLWIVWLMALFHVIVDIFRSHEMGGFAKALWLLFVIFLPFLGVLVYLIARGDNMAQHAMADAEARDAAFQSYVEEAAGSTSQADQLTQLAALQESATSPTWSTRPPRPRSWPAESTADAPAPPARAGSMLSGGAPTSSRGLGRFLVVIC